jgi:hypothetical protein
MEGFRRSCNFHRRVKYGTPSYVEIRMAGDSNHGPRNIFLGLRTLNNGAVSPPAHNSAVKGASLAAIPPTLVHEAPAITLPLAEGSISEAELQFEVALVCKFNGFWPRLVDLHS